MLGGIYNVGEESMNYSKIEIGEIIKKYVPKCVIVSTNERNYDSRDFQVSFDKIRSKGFKVRRTLEEGIKEMVTLFNFYRPLSLVKPI